MRPLRIQSSEKLVRRHIAAAWGPDRSAEYWTRPYGEPRWVVIPAGEFWMGSEAGHKDERPLHRVYLDTFAIARVPITNAQYQYFVDATGRRPPRYVDYRPPPKGKENYPVTHVTWYSAMAYCAWLRQVTGKPITLPSEAEWEKAARGDKDQREYPWGDAFEATRCNSWELGWREATPVGIFPDGASPYGVLDLSGNVSEWTRSQYEGYPYPYNPADGREDLSDDPDIDRVVRGGAFISPQDSVRCAYRGWSAPVNYHHYLGFRVMINGLG